MGRYTGPKDRLSRREGVDLFGSQPRRLDQRPGQHWRRRRRRRGEYELRLREKQKVKRMYGVREKQFRRYMDRATRSRELTGEALLKLLERRLDNVVYRLGWARTRPMARQLVSHGHLSVDGQTVDIPSYAVSPGETLRLSRRALKIGMVRQLLETPERMIPTWLERQEDGGRVLSIPHREQIDAHINEQLIIEFYSR